MGTLYPHYYTATLAQTGWKSGGHVRVLARGNWGNCSRDSVKLSPYLENWSCGAGPATLRLLQHFAVAADVVAATHDSLLQLLRSVESVVEVATCTRRKSGIRICELTTHHKREPAHG